MRSIVLLAAVLLCPVLAAQEAPGPEEQAVRNAQALLEGLTAVNKGLFGRTRYAVNAQGRRLGDLIVTVDAAKCEGEDCYRVQSQFRLGIGERSMETASEAFVTSDLRLLSEAESVREDGKFKGFKTLVLAGESYISTKSDDGKLTRKSYPARPRLIKGAATFLLPRLIPPEKGKAYSFLDWDEDQGFHEEVGTVVGPYEKGEIKGTLIHAANSEMKEDKSGKKRLVSRVDEMVVDAAGNLVRLAHGGEPFTIEIDLGRFSKEEVAKLQTPLDAVLAFWIALRDQDAALMGAAIHERKFLESTKADDKDWQNMAPEVKEAILRVGEKELAEKLVKQVLSPGMKAMVNGLSTVWFKVTMDGENKAKVELSEDFARDTGDQSEMSWTVEKNEKTGQWEFTSMITDDDDF